MNCAAEGIDLRAEPSLGIHRLYRAMTRMDLPSEPDESGCPEQASAGVERLSPKSRELPDPDERGRVYEATRAHAEAEAAQRPEEVSEPGTYWNEVPRFQRMWADHEERWPKDRQAAAGGTGRPTRPDRIAATEASLSARNATRKQSTRSAGRARLRRRSRQTCETAERENICGGWLEGFDDRLKGDDRLKEKVAGGLSITSPDATPEQVLREVPDAVRYTFCLPPENYVRGFYDIKARLESFGHEMYLSKNSWAATEYKGINTRWVTQEGQRFEVQFHTPESFHAKQNVTHSAYERLRNFLTSDAERGELEAFQREVSSQIKMPDAALDVPDYKKKGY